MPKMCFRFRVSNFKGLRELQRATKKTKIEIKRTVCLLETRLFRFETIEPNHLNTGPYPSSYERFESGGFISARCQS
jgi:hypothetical protein